MRRRARVEKVMRDAFWEGFWDGLIGEDPVSALGYSSTSGFYDLNGVRRIAFRAGWDLAARVLGEHDKGMRRMRWELAYEIPASVWAECFALGEVSS